MHNQWNPTHLIFPPTAVCSGAMRGLPNGPFVVTALPFRQDVLQLMVKLKSG